MSYSINQLAKLAGVSVRTLHHYDATGLLQPSRSAKNGYRQYGEKELLKLQQILFFRELEFPLDEIRRILASPNFDMATALADQRKLIELKKKRLTALVKTIDKTIEKITEEKNMEDKDLYGSFTKEEGDQYAEEAKQRWGHTDAYKQSAERVKKMSKEDFAKIGAEGEVLMQEIVANREKGITSDEIQGCIARHYNALRHFYEPNITMYRGLATMYVDDARFAAYYDKYVPGLAVFMRDAMLEFCNRQEAK